jgi:hypothetical protein
LLSAMLTFLICEVAGPRQPQQQWQQQQWQQPELVTADPPTS